MLPVFYLVIVLENLNAIPNSPLGKVEYLHQDQVHHALATTYSEVLIIIMIDA